MSLRDLNARHLRLIGLYSSGNAIRGGTGLVFVFLVLLTGFGMGYAIIDWPIQQAKTRGFVRGVEASDGEVLESIVDWVRPLVLRFVESREAEDAADDPAGAEEAKKAAERWVSYLMDEHSAVLSGVFLLLLFA
ncbi:MAG: hypothetical protein O7J95_15830, partial [Planctomycetota bacterium]|nr:hypothetical protein [Planctomycetota bacterium]